MASTTTRDKLLLIASLVEKYSCSIIDDPIIRIGIDKKPEFFKTLKINCDVYQDYIAVDLSQFDDHVYFNEQHFIRENPIESSSTNPLLDQKIHILSTEQCGYIYYDADDKKVVDIKNQEVNYFLIENQYFFRSFFSSLQKSKIIDYHSVSKREFFISTADMPTFHLGYDVNYEIPKTRSLKNTFLTFDELINQKDLTLIFKNVIAKHLINIDKTERLLELFLNFEKYYDLAVRDHQVYLNNFSFEKLKNELREEKEKYFTDIREILDKLLNKVVTIPISVSATAFALYRLKSDPFLSFLVVIGFIIYSSFTYYLLHIIAEENSDIRNQFKIDISKIEDNSGLPVDEIKPTKDAIKKKIKILDTSISLLKIIIGILSALVLVIYFYNLPAFLSFLKVFILKFIIFLFGSLIS